MNGSTLRLARPTPSAARALATAGLALVGILPAACFDPLIYDPPGGGSDDRDDRDDRDGTSSGEGTESSDDTGSESSDSSGAPPPVCGDGIVEGDEICDDGVNNGSYAGCASGCGALGPHCGDGLVNGGEACDDGDDENGNGCNVDCVVSGTVLWTVIYDGPDHGVDSGAGVAADGDGNVIVSINSFGSDGQRGGLRKYSPDGDSLWSTWITAPYGGTTNGGISATPRNAIVFGGNYNNNEGSRDAWVRSFSASGEPGWTSTHASTQWDLVSGIVGDEDGFIYVAFEESNAPTETGYQTLLTKYLPNGAEAWTVFHSGDIRARHIDIDGQGNLVIAGETATVPNSTWLQKIDSDGAEIWSRTLGPNDDLSSFVAASSDGQIAVAISPPDSDSRVVRLDPSGAEIDEIFPSIPGSTHLLLAGTFDNDGALIVGGSSIDGSGAVAWITKYRQDGSELWSHLHDGTQDTLYSPDRVSSIAADASGNVLATGTISEVSSASTDVLVAKYAP